MLRSCLFVAVSFAATSTTQAQDVGVAECDLFLKHYTQCIETGAPADNKKMMLDAVANMRKEFLELKSQAPAGMLQTICKDNQKGMAQTFEALKCKPM